MLKRIVAFGFVMLSGSAHADDAADLGLGYDKSFLQVDECFATGAHDQENCLIAGIQECAYSLEESLESKGMPIPGGAAVDPQEYCNIIGLERADEHLNAVYQRVLTQGPADPSHSEEGTGNLRNAQRLWLQFVNEMCSEKNIVGWSAGGSGWGAITNECITRLSIQQAGHLERYFIFND